MTDKNNTQNTSASAGETVPTGRKIVNELYDWTEIFVFSAAFVILLFSFVIRMTVVQGASMEDTLIENEFVAVSDLYFTPEQGDIVVCQDRSNTYHREPIVKRVIATEGQIVDIDFATWTVTVDGIVVEEPYIKLAADRRITSDWDYPYEVPENHIFVMGDNRNHSADSRSEEIGPVDVRCIVGKAVLRVFPFHKITYLG